MVTVTYENVYNSISPHNQIVFESHYLNSCLLLQFIERGGIFDMRNVFLFLKI